MLATKNEINFLLSALHPQANILEYGSGDSTIMISRICPRLVSIEHDQNWYEKIKPNLPKSVTYLLRKPEADWHYLEDGNINQFKNYIEAPLPWKPYDIIFIDGRARRDCAFFTKKVSHPKTRIFIHDFYLNNPPSDRSDYLDCLEIMDIVNNQESLYEFRLKIHN